MAESQARVELARYAALDAGLVRAPGGVSLRLLLTCLLLSLGCTELAPGSDRLQSTEASLKEAGAPVDARWACLGEAPEPAAMALGVQPVLTLRVVDIGSGIAPAELTARACQRLDVNCLTPVVSDVALSEDGALHLPVPLTFDGFVELRSPASVPTMYFVNQPMLGDRVESFRLLNYLGFRALATQGGVLVDPELGHLLIRSFDCEGAPASSVRLSNDKGGEPFSFVAGLPSIGADVTTADGLGGFVNVPPVLVVVEGRQLDADRVISRVSVSVRAGWFTYGDVEPLR